MNIRKRSSFVVALCSALLVLSACGGGASSDDASTTTPISDPTPTDGSQSRAQLAGYGNECISLGSTYGAGLSSSVLTRYINLKADGTYDFSTNIVVGATCSFGHSSGGTVATQVNESGNWSVAGTNTTPSTSTKLVLASTSYYFTVYNPQSNSTALAIANWANNCTGGPTAFSTTASSTRTFQPTMCTAVGGINLAAVTVPASIGTPQFNVGYRLSTLQTGSSSNPPWHFSAGSYPTSYSITWQ